MNIEQKIEALLSQAGAVFVAQDRDMQELTLFATVSDLKALAAALADERRQRQRLEDALREVGLFLDHVHGELAASGGALFESELQSLLERLDLGRSKVKAALASTQQAGGDEDGR